MTPVIWWIERDERGEVYLCDSCAIHAPDAKRCDEYEAAREHARGTRCDDCGEEV